MTREEWLRIKGIVIDTWALPDGARDAFLAEACAGDDDLRREVDQLLASSAAAERLYETPIVTIGGRPAVFADVVHPGVTAGSMIGAYRVIREIGRGGMGSVHLATRADGAFDQQVAIKLVHLLANEQLRERFHNERRILATLTHANIAHLVDGGTTADGVPFLSMEYVEGVPIDEFCETRELDLVERLELFRQVCAAVQYAHQRLVIHRDIKANNILVTADGTPKLLDFGIAKMLEPGNEGAGRTVLRALTPDSASPEQVRGDPITIATDVYALGVLLYRLLSGQSPYGSQQLTEAALLRAICDDEPTAPLVARSRTGAPALAAGRFSRDLDLIVLKALRKEPERRYASVAQLSDDLDRFLRGEPVLAAPDSRLYRTQKLLARHRISAALGLLAVVAILTGAAVAASQAAIARAERLRAEQRFNEVRQMANAFVFEFHDAIADLPGSLAARQLVVKRAAEYLDQLARADGEDDVGLQRELARANSRLADIMGGVGVSSLGDYQGAETRYRMALDVFERLAARPNAEFADIEALAQLRVLMSRFLIVKGDLVGAERSASDAVALLLSKAGDRPINVATAYHQLGFAQARLGRHEAALASLREATARAQRQLAADPGDASGIARLARIATDYGEALLGGDDPDEALAVLNEARASLERLVGREPFNTRHRLSLVYLLNTVGQALAMRREHRTAMTTLAASLALVEALHQDAPDDYGIRLALMITRHYCGVSQVRAGERRAGIRSLRQTVDDAQDLVRPSPTNAFMANQLAAARVELGAALLASNPASREGCDTLALGLQGWATLEARGQMPGDSGRVRPTFERLRARCESAGRR